jgi:hypothetical protein
MTHVPAILPDARSAKVSDISSGAATIPPGVTGKSSARQEKGGEPAIWAVRGMRAATMMFTET